MPSLARVALAILIFSLGAPALGQTPQAPAPAAASETAVQEPAEAKKICKQEYITGSRLKKQMVCRTIGFDKDVQRTQDGMRRFMNNSGNISPHPPGVPG
jgi:hypothetical protein